MTRSETNGDAETGTRLPYVKPGFRTINLVSEEVMAVGCKLPASAGPNSGGGLTCTVPTPCLNFSGVS
jgi:hypothetical protein